MIVIGLTGGIGSGKSTVLRVFQRLGAYGIDADRLSRQVVARGKPACHEIRRRFGAEFFFKNGWLNRKKLANKVFKDKKALAELNAIIHPRVFEAEKQIIAAIARKKENAMVVVDAPLMIESGSYKWKDVVVVINTSVENQVRRLCAERKFTRVQAMARIRAQMPVSGKLKFAHYIINNNGTIAQLRKATEATFREIVHGVHAPRKPERAIQ